MRARSVTQVGHRLDRVRSLVGRLSTGETFAEDQPLDEFQLRRARAHWRLRTALHRERDRLESEYDRQVRAEIVRRLLSGAER